MLRLIVAVVGLWALAGCGNANDVDRGQRANEGADQAALIPKDANNADRALMDVWLDQNELCQGSPDAATIDVMCPERNRTQAKLEQRGWCWAYADRTVVRADYRWHRCSVTSLPADERSVSFDDQATKEDRATAQSAIHYDDEWAELKENPGSSRLAAYFEVAEPIDIKIGNAGAILKCGIQNVDWYRGVTENLEAYRAGPVVGPLFAKLTDQEKRRAHRFDKVVADGMMEFSGGTFRKKDCDTLAQMPFVYSADAFRP